MLLPINHESKMPLYIQIYQRIKEKIHMNELKTNEKLTSKRQLAEMNQVSENTVMNAYNQLLIEGYIYSKERKGYFVSSTELHYELPSLINMDDLKTAKPEVKYNLTIPNPDKDLFPFSVFSKLYRNVLNHPPEKLLGETVGQGLLELRTALQHYLSRSRGVPCTTDQILLGPSAEYLICILIQLLDEKPVAGIEDPGYNRFDSLFKRLMVPTEAIPVDEMGIDIQDLQKSAVDLMIVTSNHQFPTGSIMPLPRRQQLLDWANKEKNRYVIEDDYDSEFKYSGIPIPALKYLDKGNKVIHLGSFTRVLSPGIRVSYMVLPDTLMALYQKKFSAPSAPLSTFGQWVISDFITEGHFTTHLNRSRTFYKKKREMMIHIIHKYDEHATIYGENAGLHLLFKPSFRFNGQLFIKMALEESIELNLLSDFATEQKEEYENTLFLSFSHIPKEDIEKVIQILYILAKKCAL